AGYCTATSSAAWGLDSASPSILPQHGLHGADPWSGERTPARAAHRHPRPFGREEAPEHVLGKLAAAFELRPKHFVLLTQFFEIRVIASPASHLWKRIVFGKHALCQLSVVPPPRFRSHRVRKRKRQRVGKIGRRNTILFQIFLTFDFHLPVGRE